MGGEAMFILNLDDDLDRKQRANFDLGKEDFLGALDESDLNAIRGGFFGTVGPINISTPDVSPTPPTPLPGNGGGFAVSQEPPCFRPVDNYMSG